MLLSIITINFNNRNGLIKTMMSVIPELTNDFEYIIIDGNSTDGSVEEIKKREKYLSYWISEPDSGIYHAMNKGVEKSSGEWILFMNSGDLLIADSLTQVFRHDLDSYHIIYGQNYSSKQGLKGKLVIKDWEWTLISFMEGCIPHQSTLTRRKTLLEFPFKQNYKLASCRIFFIETIISAELKYKYLPIPISIYDIDGQSATQKDLLLNELDDFLINSLGSKITADLKELQRHRSKTDGRDLYRLLLYSSGRPRIKKKIDAMARLILYLLKALK